MTLNKVALAVASAEVSGNLTIVGDAVVYDAGPYQSVSIQVSGTFVGTIVFEVSNNNVDWIAKTLLNQNTNAGLSSVTTPALVAGDIGARYIRARRSVATSGVAVITMELAGASQAPIIATQAISGAVTIAAAASSMVKTEDAEHTSGDAGVHMLGVRRDNPTIDTSADNDYASQKVDRHGAIYTRTIDSAKRTYAAAIKLTPIVGQILEVVGAASTTIEINRITVTLYGTAVGKMDVVVNKRSTASAGGTSANLAKVPYDAADAASVATVRTFSVTPTTLGTLVGQMRVAMLSIAASQASDRLKLESGQYSKSFTLTAATQAITVDLAGTVPTGAEMAIDIEWTEY